MIMIYKCLKNWSRKLPNNCWNIVDRNKLCFVMSRLERTDPHLPGAAQDRHSRTPQSSKCLSLAVFGPLFKPNVCSDLVTNPVPTWKRFCLETLKWLSPRGEADAREGRLHGKGWCPHQQGRIQRVAKPLGWRNLVAACDCISWIILGWCLYLSSIFAGMMGVFF